MKQKWIKLMGVAVTVASLAASAYASELGTLTIADNNANSITPLTTSGGAVTYNGAVGNWSINVSTGTLLGSSGSPIIDLNSIDANYSGSTIGDQLTIEFNVTGIGPLQANYADLLGGTLSGLNAQFYVVLPGNVLVDLQNFTGPTAFSGMTTVGVGGDTSLGIEAVLTAPTGAGLGSFNDNLNPNVPDGGATVMLLGAALSAMALLRKKLVA